MLTTFHNVEITVEAPTPEAAYEKLCDLFETQIKELSYTTDSFTTDADPETDRDTSELWPEDAQ